MESFCTFAGVRTVAARRLSPFATRGDVRLNATILQVLHVLRREIPAIGQQRLGHLPLDTQHPIHHRHQVLLVRRLVAHPVGKDHLMGLIHDELCVVGLNVGPVFDHDATVGIGEVVLRRRASALPFTSLATRCRGNSC